MKPSNSVMGAMPPLLLALFTGAVSLLVSGIEGDHAGYMKAVRLTANVLRDVGRLDLHWTLNYSGSADPEASPSVKIHDVFEDGGGAPWDHVAWRAALASQEWSTYVDGPLHDAVVRRVDSLKDLEAHTDSHPESLGLMQAITLRRLGPSRRPDPASGSWVGQQKHFPARGVSVLMEVFERERPESQAKFEFRVVATSRWSSVEIAGSGPMLPESARLVVSDHLVRTGFFMLAKEDLFLVGQRGASRMLARALHSKWYFLILIVAAAALLSALAAFRSPQVRTRLAGALHLLVALFLFGFIPVFNGMSRVCPPLDIGWIESGLAEVVFALCLVVVSVFYANRVRKNLRKLDSRVPSQGSRVSAADQVGDGVHEALPPSTGAAPPA